MIARGNDPYLNPSGGAAEIYLIRHGDAIPDAGEVALDGAYDSQGLSALGRRQALALVERLRAVALASIYSSPIPRARQTAEPTAQALKLEVRIEPELREIAVGPIGPPLPPSPTPEQVALALRERMLEIATVALGSGRWRDIPGSEPAASLRARALAVVHRIAAAHDGERVAIFSHGGLINAYFAELLGIERDYFFAASNSGISIVRIKGEHRLLLVLNDVSHLRQAGLL